MSPTFAYIDAPDIPAGLTCAEYRRRVAGDATRSHWSKARTKVRRQWRARARRVEQ